MAIFCKRFTFLENMFKTPSNLLLTVQGRYFCCGSLLPVFGAIVAVMFYHMCVHNMVSSVWVAEWPFFGKELLTRLTMCSLCILTICNFSYFLIWF